MNSESIWNKQVGFGVSVWPPMWWVTESAATERMGVLQGMEETDRIQCCALCEALTALSRKFPMGQTSLERGGEEQRM